MSISDANLSEANYGFEANKSDTDRRIESIKKVKQAFEQYQIDKKSFETHLQTLVNKLNHQ